MNIITTLFVLIAATFGFGDYNVGGLIYKDYDRAAIERHISKGSKVAILFHADWCGPCKSFARGPLQRPSYLLKAVRVPMYHVDLTTKSGKAWGILDEFGGRGIPFYVILDKNGVVYKGRDINKIIRNL